MSPFKSQAQRAKFYATPKLRKYIPEFESATPKGKKLPKKVAQTKKGAIRGTQHSKTRKSS